MPQGEQELSFFLPGAQGPGATPQDEPIYSGV